MTLTANPEITLLAPESVTFAALEAQATGPRPCRMDPAYAGAVFEHPLWGPTVIDVSGIKVPADGVPLYRQHDPGLYLGRSSSVELADGRVRVVGFLFRGVPAADEVARISDQGGKWQASIKAVPNLDCVETFDTGTVKVNGVELSAPLTVWRESYLREVSFTPRGVDTSTSAIALSGTNETTKAAGRPRENTMDPVQQERARVKSIREAFPKHREFADKQIDAGATLADAKAAFAEIALAELAEREKAHEAALAAEKTAREAAEKKAAEAQAKLAKPSFGAALGAPGAGGMADDSPGLGSDDPIARWEAALAAEVAKVKPDEVAELAARRGIALSDDAHARAIAVARLGQRDPKLRDSYVAAFNARGIGSRVRNNKAR